MATKQNADPATPRRTPHPTIATIAAQMNLSRATVTHVLNGRATQQRISPDTQRRVLEVAQELGYRANASARAIRAGRFGNIALVQSVLGQYLPRELLTGLMKAIADKDLHLVLSQVPDIVIDEESYLPHTMRELSADGLLVYRHVGFAPTFLERIRKWHIPAIFLNTKQEFDAVHPDDLAGGRLATGFLLDLGHERIAYVHSVEEDEALTHYSQRDRRAGYRQEMTSAGKTPWVHVLPRAWEGAGEPGVDQRVQTARQLLARDDRPTAVVAYEMAEAMAVVHAAHSLGMRVPQDLSVILFHNRQDDRYFVPFHTISNAMEATGAGAVMMLLEKIEDPDVVLPTRVVPVEMMEGVTCLPPRK